MPFDDLIIRKKNSLVAIFCMFWYVLIKYCVYPIHFIDFYTVRLVYLSMTAVLNLSNIYYIVRKCEVRNCE